MKNLNDLRLVLAYMMRDENGCKTLGESSDNMEKYIPEIVKLFNTKDSSQQHLDASDCVASFIDWNKMPIETMARYLKEQYEFQNTGDAKAIFTLIEFYDKHK